MKKRDGGKEDERVEARRSNYQNEKSTRKIQKGRQ